MLYRLSDRLLSQIFWLLVILFIVLAVTRDAGLLPKDKQLYCLLAVGGALIWVRGVITRRFRSFVFTPIKLRNVPRVTRKYFQSHSTGLEEVGFTFLGDYVLLPEPRSLTSRILISAGRKCLAEISRWDGLHLCSFVSVTLDGRYFETTSLPGSPRVGDGVPLDFMCLPGHELLDMLQMHIQRVRDYESDTGTEALKIGRDKFQDIINYGHRLAGHDCHQQGFKSTGPPELVDDQQPAVTA